jgi:hypothetical protein
MARKSDPLSDSFGTDDSDGWLGGIVADEDDLDRHTLWRLGLWGVAAVGALTLGIMSGQLPVNAQRTQVAANEFAGRAKQVESTVQENQLEARRLAAAIATLNSDRDRLFTRLSAIEQGLDVVTGSINKKADDKLATTAWPTTAIAPVVSGGIGPLIMETAPGKISMPAPVPAPPPSTVAAPAVEPEPAPTTLAAHTEPPPAEEPAPSVIQAMPIPEPQPAHAGANASLAAESMVAPADFGLDLGAANSINGLRALWRGLIKSHKPQLDGLRPLIAVHERRNGLGLQLRLVAGPIKDAAAAARICAVLSDAERDCKTTAFDGQRLSLAAEPAEKAAPPRAQKQRKSTRAQPEAMAPKPAEQSAFATMLGIR